MNERIESLDYEIIDMSDGKINRSFTHYLECIEYIDKYSYPSEFIAFYAKRNDYFITKLLINYYGDYYIDIVIDNCPNNAYRLLSMSSNINKILEKLSNDSNISYHILHLLIQKFDYYNIDNKFDILKKIIINNKNKKYINKIIQKLYYEINCNITNNYTKYNMLKDVVKLINITKIKHFNIKEYTFLKRKINKGKYDTYLSLLMIGISVFGIWYTSTNNNITPEIRLHYALE